MTAPSWWPDTLNYDPPTRAALDVLGGARPDEVFIDVGPLPDLDSAERMGRLAGALADQCGCSGPVVDAVVRLIVASGGADRDQRIRAEIVASDAIDALELLGVTPRLAEDVPHD